MMTEDRVPTPLRDRIAALADIPFEPGPYQDGWRGAVKDALYWIDCEASAQPAPPTVRLFADGREVADQRAASAQPAPPLDVAAEVAYEMKVFLHGAESAPPVAPGWLAQIEKWCERLVRGLEQK